MFKFIMKKLGFFYLNRNVYLYNIDNFFKVKHFYNSISTNLLCMFNQLGLYFICNLCNYDKFKDNNKKENNKKKIDKRSLIRI